MNLAKLKCVACRGGDLSLTDAEIAELLPQVPEWQTVAQDGILRYEMRSHYADPWNPWRDHRHSR